MVTTLYRATTPFSFRGHGCGQVSLRPASLVHNLIFTPRVSFHSRGDRIPGFLGVYSRGTCFSTFSSFLRPASSSSKRFETNSVRKKSTLCRKVNSRQECVEQHDQTCLKKNNLKSRDPSTNTVLFECGEKMKKNTPKISNFREEALTSFFFVFIFLRRTSQTLSPAAKHPKKKHLRRNRPKKKFMSRNRPKKNLGETSPTLKKSPPAK